MFERVFFYVIDDFISDWHFFGRSLVIHELFDRDHVTREIGIDFFVGISLVNFRPLNDKDVVEVFEGLLLDKRFKIWILLGFDDLFVLGKLFVVFQIVRFDPFLLNDCEFYYAFVLVTHWLK